MERIIAIRNLHSAGMISDAIAAVRIMLISPPEMWRDLVEENINSSPEAMEAVSLALQIRRAHELAEANIERNRSYRL